MIKRNALLVGSFAIAALVLLVLGVLWISDNTLFTRQQRAVLYVAGNVSGLYVGAPVTFRGVPVGVVDDIGIEIESGTLNARIPVQLRLRPSTLRYTDGRAVQNPVPIDRAVERGLRARLVAQSFVTGQKSIELDFLPDTPKTLVGHADEPEIPVVAERFGAIVDQLAELPLSDTVREIRVAANHLSQTLVGMRRAIDDAEALLTTTTREIAGVGAESRAALRAATAAVQRIETQAGRTLEAATRLADSSNETVRGMQPDLTAAVADARRAADAARLAMERIAELAAPGAPLRGDLDAAVRDLSQAARGLRDWSELLEERPNAVIFGSGRQ